MNLRLRERRRDLARQDRAAAKVAAASSTDPPPTFRAFAEAKNLCGLDLSPLVAAIADASEARPIALDDVAAQTHFGCEAARLPATPPRTVVVRAGGRGGKTSRLLAPKALHAAWTVPLPLLGPGEVGYAVIFAPDLKLARQALSFCKGYVDESPTLRAALVEEPTADALTLKRPDGRIVRVEVFAASRGGKGGRGKSLVFAGLDEACFFRDEATGVVNDAEMYRAVIQRVVPGGQVWIVSTPWLAGVGLLEELVGKNFGSHEHALCALAPTRALNPAWDPDGEIERDLRENDPDNAEREIDAVPMAAGSAMFFDPNAIKAAVDEDRPLEAPYRGGAAYGAGGDLAFKRDSSALAIAELCDGRYAIAALDELRPEKGAPLKSSAVVGQFAGTMRRYACGDLTLDSHEREAATDDLAAHGLTALPAPEGHGGKAESYIAFRRLLHEGRLTLPNHPRFLRQLRDIVSKPMPGGGLSITSPRRTGGGHGDLVSAAVLAVWRLAHPAEDLTARESHLTY